MLAQRIDVPPEALQAVAQRAAKTLLERREQRKHLSAFVAKTFALVDPGAAFKHNWHIDLISEYLEACFEHEILNLVINMPPRFMKSICGSVAFPAWMLGRRPSEQILCGSYSGKLSIKHSVDCRAVMESPWYGSLFPETVIASDQNEKTKYQTTKRGHRIATSVGGTATGEGGNYLIMDDPLNPKQAASDTERTGANEWLDQSWANRKNDPKTACEILIMQRLHSHDATGHMLEKVEGDIVHLVIPQEAEMRTTVVFPRSGRVLVREEGDLLHEERVGPDEIASMKRRYGSYGYAAQQQQRPAPKGGGIIKLEWFRRYTTPPAASKIQMLRISIDTASKEKEINDPSAAGVWAETDEGHFLLEMWKDRLGYPALKRRVKNLCLKWAPNELLIEDKSSGQSLIQDLNDDKEFKTPVIPMEPGKDGKVVRASVESPSIEAGLVWLPESAPWLHDFEQEILNFPNGEHDDQIDQLTQYLKRTRTRPVAAPQVRPL